MTSRRLAPLPWALLALAAWAGVQVASAQEAPSVHVDRVVGAAGGARDVVGFAGKVLVATQGGLVVRDGDVTERVLGPAEGMPGARLISVSVTPAGLWVGGVEGAVLLDEELAVVRRVALARVSRVVEFAGQSYAATFGRGLFRVSADVPEHVHLGNSNARDRQTDALVVGDELWVSTAGAGILRVGVDGALRSRFTHVAGLVDDLVWDLAPAPDGGVFAATGLGVNEIRDRRVRSGAPITRASAELAIRDVRSVVAAPGGALLCTYGGGVLRVRGAHAVSLAEDASIELQRVRAMRRVDGVAYAASDGGLMRVDGQRVVVVDGGTGSADITSLARAFGQVWVGTFDHGLARLVGDRLVPVSVATGRWDMDGRVNDLAVTGRGDAQLLYVATDRGLYRHDGRSFVPVVESGAPPQDHITSLFVEPRSGVLWVTGSGYLGRFDGQAWRSWSGDALPSAHLHAVARDAGGHMWVGSLRGLFELNEASSEFVRHDVATGDLPVNWVTALVPWGRGVVAGTYHGGLSWADSEGFQVERESAAGLPAGWVNPHAMATVDGRLWVGMQSRGLVIGGRGQWRHLTLADGLPSDDVTDVLPDGSGAAWVATRGGLTHVVVDAAPGGA